MCTCTHVYTWRLHTHNQPTHKQPQTNKQTNNQPPPPKKKQTNTLPPPLTHTKNKNQGVGFDATPTAVPALRRRLQDRQKTLQAEIFALAASGGGGGAGGAITEFNVDSPEQVCVRFVVDGGVLCVCVCVFYVSVGVCGGACLAICGWVGGSINWRRRPPPRRRFSVWRPAHPPRTDPPTNRLRQRPPQQTHTCCRQLPPAFTHNQPPPPPHTRTQTCCRSWCPIFTHNQSIVYQSLPPPLSCCRCPCQPAPSHPQSPPPPYYLVLLFSGGRRPLRQAQAPRPAARRARCVVACLSVLMHIKYQTPVFCRFTPLCRESKRALCVV